MAVERFVPPVCQTLIKLNKIDEILGYAGAFCCPALDKKIAYLLT